MNEQVVTWKFGQVKTSDRRYGKTYNYYDKTCLFLPLTLSLAGSKMRPNIGW
jgi:hypothetical protein